MEVRRHVLQAITLLGAVSACTTAPDSPPLSARVHAINTPLPTVTGAPGAFRSLAFTSSGSSSYTYVAAVDAPTNPATGDLLQATNFAFDATHAYVTYNTMGPTTEGALDVVDLSVPSAPALIGSLLFPSAEFSDIALGGTFAFLVGADLDGSVLVVVDVSDPTAPIEVTRLALASYYGTSITLDNTTAYIASGDSGGIVRVDLQDPTLPVLLDTTPLPNALSIVLTGGNTLALGGAADAQLYAIGGGAATPLAAIAPVPFVSPARMVFANGHVVTNGTHAGLSVLDVAADASSASVAFHADLDGTGNGVDVAGNLAILAQGEAGTFLYDVSDPTAPSPLGSFAFPDERGSSNEVRFGAAGGAEYIFLSDGLNGFRIIQIATDDGTTCSTQWWLASQPGDWWAAPSTTDATSPGTWNAVPSETDDLCLVEEFTPTADNAACSAIQLKRAIAIGPRPNEGQTCPVRCPEGTVIANVHTRYGEASPLNDGGDYTCTGTTEPDSHEIACDIMSDACDGTYLTCSVTYHNSFCGDPWYGCIKSGRTKWQCVPDGETTTQ